MLHFINNIELPKLRKYILTISIIIMFISCIVLFFWNNTITELVFSTILINLSINIFSTLLLFYLLDKKELEKTKKLHLEKQNDIIEISLIPIIKDFYIFTLYMYRDVKHLSHNIDTFDIFDDFNQFYENIIKLDLKSMSYEGKFSDLDILDIHSYTWYESCLLHFTTYINDIIKFKNTYYLFINQDILKNLSIIESKNRNLNDFRHICKLIKCSEEELRRDITKVAFENLGLNDIYIATNNIAHLINENNSFWLDEDIISGIKFIHLLA